MQNTFTPVSNIYIRSKKYAPALAMKYDIPLIFYGENESNTVIQLTTMIVH